MRITRLLLATTALLAVSAPVARAQDVLEAASGRTYEGKVISNDGTSVEITTTAGATLKLPIDGLTLKSQYRLKLAQTAADAKSHLDLAEWCVEKTLYIEARNEFRKALAADETMADEINAHLAIARTTAANELLERAKKLTASNQTQEARRILSAMVQELPEEQASKEAAQMLADETAQREQSALARKSSRAAGGASAGGAAGPATAPAMKENGEPFSDATRALFQPVIDSYKKLLAATHAGLVKGGSAGINEFEKALKEGANIRKLAAKLQPQTANNEEVVEALALVDSKLEEAVVDVRINLVDNYLIRSSYNQAAEVVQAGLAEYPKNESLRAAMNRVTAATTDDSGGGWVVGGGRLRGR